MSQIMLTSVEQGMIFALLAIGVMISFNILGIPDLSVEGTFPLGAFILVWTINMKIHPVLGLVIAFLAGTLAGCLTYLLYRKLKIAPILSGILTMTILYTINLKVTGRSNVPLVKQATFLKLFQTMPKLVVLALIALAIKLGLDWFLNTEKGYLLKVTGDNPTLVKSLGQRPDTYILLGLALSNGLAALSGALIGQYQGFVDITMGQSMIVTALASLVIGDALIKGSSLLNGTSRALIGAIIYRIIYGLAIHLGLNPDDLKAVTAIIVIVFIAYNNYYAFRLKSRRIRKLGD